MGARGKGAAVETPCLAPSAIEDLPTAAENLSWLARSVDWEVARKPPEFAGAPAENAVGLAPFPKLPVAASFGSW